MNRDDDGGNLGLFDPPRSHRNDPWTSRAAAETAKSGAASQRAAIMAYLGELGERGATADEVDHHFGWRHLTAARRLTELHQAGHLICRGDTRPSDTGCHARVYRRAQ